MNKSIFVCWACGKWSEDKYGDKEHSKGWDAACVMNSSLVDVTRLVFSEDKQRVVRVKEKENG